MIPTYQEFSPHPALNRFIKVFWTLKGTFSEPSVYRVFPDCCSDLIVDNLQKTLNMSVADRTYFDVMFNKDVNLFGIRFNPGGLQSLCRTCNPDLIPESLFYKNLSRMIAYDCEKESVENFLLSFSEKILTDAVMDYWIAYGGEGKGISDYFSISKKTVYRRLGSYSGLSPVLLGRIRRFQKSLTILDKSSSFVYAALDSGYYDQPHFIKDFRTFTGVSPSVFRGKINSFGVRFLQFPSGII